MTNVGQFSVPALSGVHAAAVQIAVSTQSASQAAGLVPAYRQGVIISVDGGTPPSCTVTFDGATNVAGVQFLDSYFPTVSDIVVCVVSGATAWILGQLATASPLLLKVPTLDVTGATTLDGGVTVTGDTATGTLHTTGLTTLGSGANVTGTTDTDTLLVNGSSPMLSTTTARLVQAGSSVVSTDASGNATISFPQTFPTAVDTIVCNNGDWASFPGCIITRQSQWTTSAFVIKAYKDFTTPTLLAGTMRVDWIAVGH